MGFSFFLWSSVWTATSTCISIYGGVFSSRNNHLSHYPYSPPLDSEMFGSSSSQSTPPSLSLSNSTSPIHLLLFGGFYSKYNSDAFNCMVWENFCKNGAIKTTTKSMAVAVAVAAHAERRPDGIPFWVFFFCLAHPSFRGREEDWRRECEMQGEKKPNGKSSSVGYFGFACGDFWAFRVHTWESSYIVPQTKTKQIRKENSEAFQLNKTAMVKSTQKPKEQV